LRFTAGLVCGTLILSFLLLSGCILFNRPPIARIEADPLNGESPLSVTFDASASSDPDGDQLTYEWDFGDGGKETGRVVYHVFTATGGTEVYAVTLTVTDGRGGRSVTSQSIEVFPPSDGGTGGTGFPVARFTADRIIGRIPLTVSFDATESTGGRGEIVEYDWDFGDGEKGIGSRIAHTFEPAETETYTVTLFVWNSEGDVATEQAEIIVVVPDPQGGDEEPVADISVLQLVQTYHSTDMPNVPSFFEVTLSPAGSYADAGHTIEYYAWDFGDGALVVETSDMDVTHIYELHAPTHTYIARLSVFDDQGYEDTKSVNITLTDHE